MLLRMGYSPLHPFFRPAVAAPNAAFERHQNPLSRELCLLTQEAGQWDANQLVADFIQERPEHLLRALKARKDGRWDDSAKLEEQVADPLMPYFLGTSEDESVILFDGQAGFATQYVSLSRSRSSRGGITWWSRRSSMLPAFSPRSM
jgi:hypothetical protein